MEIIEGKLYFIKDEIDKKTRDIFALTNKGIIATFTNLPEFIKDIKKEKLKTGKI